MHALRCMVHVGVGRPRRIVPLIMFPRPRQAGEFAMHGILGLGQIRRVRCVERQRRRPCERRAHQRHRPEHVGPHQRAPCRDRAAEIMPDYGISASVAERRQQAERVARQIEQPERTEVTVIAGVPAGGAAIAALVRRDHVIAGRRQRRHHLAPAIGQFRKTVQQQHARPAFGFEASLQHMHAQAVDVFHEARADAGRERDVGEAGGVHGRQIPISSW
jgi:hypothetical protein